MTANTKYIQGTQKLRALADARTGHPSVADIHVQYAGDDVLSPISYVDVTGRNGDTTTFHNDNLAYECQTWNQP